jgi:hypothetical protein
MKLIIVFICIAVIFGLIIFLIYKPGNPDDGNDQVSNAPSYSQNKCFPTLKWPNCKPNNTTVMDCNEIFIDNTMPQNGLKPKYKDVKCCLSSPMYKYSNMKTGNCPYGWTNNPQNSNEWCTDKVNFFWPNQIRHKCYPDPNFKV